VCGIVGMVHAGNSPAIDPALLARMTATLAHRGPDDAGTFVDPRAGVAFGHRRLSIIDLASGQQPMADASGRLTIVFNGEIYNHRLLRAELEKRGARFRTQSDTEVILELYRLEGETAFARLNGMFAFAIWDAPRSRLVAARDHLGVKPFYWHHKDGVFLFASEVKALLEHPTVAREVDLEALQECLAFRFVPSPRTLFLGVSKLPPGHLLVLDRAHGLRLQRFWNSVPAIDRAIPLPQAIELYQARLESAVERQMISDVPIGVMLSGGLDSGVVAAITARAAGSARRIQSFTIGFEGGE
jgi:asparagine synthase (glutamine-hydrolysing)